MRKSGSHTLGFVAVALAALLLAACGGDDDSSLGRVAVAVARAADRSRSRRPRSRTSSIPALTYTRERLEPLWLVYTPLLTYPRTEGPTGLRADPGLAEDLPKVSKDGKTYRLTLRKGLKYSDGSPVKASDFEHAIQRVLNLESGGSAVLPRIEGADAVREVRQVPSADISGIEAERQDRRHHDQADRAGRLLLQRARRCGSPALVPGDTPFKNLTKDPPPGVGPYKITESVPNRDFVIEKNKLFPTSARTSRRARSTRSRPRSSSPARSRRRT